MCVFRYVPLRFVTVCVHERRRRINQEQREFDLEDRSRWDSRERLKKEQQNRACVEIGTSCQTLKLSTPFTSLNTAQFHLRPHTHPMLASDAEYHCSNNNVHIDFILYITVNEHDTSVMAHQRPFVLNYNRLQQ